MALRGTHIDEIEARVSRRRGAENMRMGTGKGIGTRRLGGIGTELVTALAAAYLVTVLALFGMAAVMLKAEPDVKTMELIILGIYFLSCFAGGWCAGRKAGQRKFLHGLVTGLLYFAVLFAVSNLGERELQSDLLRGGLSCLLCAAGGMFGGMLA